MRASAERTTSSDIAGDGLALTAIEYSHKMTVISVLVNDKNCDCKRS
jgi:hypothetical protein